MAQKLERRDRRAARTGHQNGSDLERDRLNESSQISSGPPLERAAPSRRTSDELDEEE